MTHADAIAIARLFSRALITEQYDELLALVGSSDASAPELQGVMQQYGRLHCLPPETMWNSLVAVFPRIDGTTWDVDVDLWCCNERSDLTLQLRVSDVDHRRSFIIRGLHIL